MLQSFRSLARAVVGTLALTTVALASEGWIADYDQALAVAKAEHKDLFIDFTGSDWCGWCKKLDAEVFSKDEFLTEIKKDFVLVALDFPRAKEVKAKVPNPKRNQELAQQNNVSGYPTILLVNSDGVAYAQTGYQPGGAVKYVEHIKDIKTKGLAVLKEVNTLLDAWTKAKDDAKGAAWDKVADMFEKKYEEAPRAVGLLTAPLKEALTFDKDNKAGKKLRAMKILMKLDMGDEAMITEARLLDPKNEKGLLEMAVKAQFATVQDDDAAKAALDELDKLDLLGPRKDKTVDFDLHIMAANICANHLDDAERAKKYATIAKAAGSDNKEALKFLDGILGS